MATQEKQASVLSDCVAQSQRRPATSAAQLEGAQWRKSSQSGAGECVTVAQVGDCIALRNSKRPDEGTLLFERGAMAVWIAGCKAGRFDYLTTTA